MNNLHLVSHTHWDREWYLPFQQFRLKLVHLVDRLLDIFEQEPGYYSFLLDGQAIILEDYLQIRPECEAKLRSYVSAGRLIIGPWYISPDEFLVSPESHIRNLLEGDRICRKFGAKMSIGYLPDSFGHIGQMPQILQGFGITSACLFRGLDDESVELNWKAPDGSSVLLSYLRDGYSNAAGLSTNDLERFIHEINDLSQSLAPFSLTGEILLMHGTDHMEPSKELPGAIEGHRKTSPQNHLIHSSLPGYFNAIRSLLASRAVEPLTILGELRSSKRSPILPNVLSTRMWIKQRNHECENHLVKWVEPMHAWNHFITLQPVNDEPNPDNPDHTSLAGQASLIQNAWKLLMQCHPHDSICGTSIDQVAKEMQVRFDQVDQISQELISLNLQMICNQIDTVFRDVHKAMSPNDGILLSIIVFNPNDQIQSGMIDLHIMLDTRYASIEIIDDQNMVIPHHQKGLGLSELISMTMDEKGMRQALGMIHEGNVAGLMIRDFHIETERKKANIVATLSDHGQVDLVKWRQGVAKLEEVFADPDINEFVVHAYSDPEIDLKFIARNIPGHGYRRYWIRGYGEGKAMDVEPKKLNPFLHRLLPFAALASKIPFVTKLIKGRKSKATGRHPKIENEFFSVAASSSDGTLLIVDKRTQQIYSGLNRFIDGADCGDEYNYAPPLQDRWIRSSRISVERQINEVSQNLVVRVRLPLPRALSDDRKSRSRNTINHNLTSTITLITGVPRIDIHTELDNQARDHRLRVHFPAPFGCTSAFFDGHFEVVERPLDLPRYDESWVEPPRPEVPQRAFTLVTNDQASLIIANRGLPEVEVLRNEFGSAEIAVTLLRCVGWLSRDDFSTRKGHAGPMGIATPDAQMIGHHSFDYSIIPGNSHIQNLIHQAYAFNAPLKAISTTIHSGILKSDQALITVDNSNFILTAIKMSEDGLRLIVRGFNLVATPIEVNLTPYRPFNQAFVTNLAEEKTQPLSVDQNGSIHLGAGGKKIISISFQD